MAAFEVSIHWVEYKIHNMACGPAFKEGKLLTTFPRRLFDLLFAHL